MLGRIDWLIHSKLLSCNVFLSMLAEIKTNTHFEDEYLFIVLKKADEWRIDSYKNRRYGNEKWSA